MLVLVTSPPCTSGEEFRGSAEFLLLKKRGLGVMCWPCCLRDVWDRSSILLCCVPPCWSGATARPLVTVCCRPIMWWLPRGAEAAQGGRV